MFFLIALQNLAAIENGKESNKIGMYFLNVCIKNEYGSNFLIQKIMKQEYA